MLRWIAASCAGPSSAPTWPGAGAVTRPGEPSPPGFGTKLGDGEPTKPDILGRVAGRQANLAAIQRQEAVGPIRLARGTREKDSKRLDSTRSKAGLLEQLTFGRV